MSNINYMTKVFSQKWDQGYRRVKHKMGVDVSEQTLFGPIESFDKKQIGPYHIIKNISYAQYRGNATVTKKIEETTIQLPFSPDKFHFSQIPYYQVIAFVDLDSRRLIYPLETENQERLKEDEYLTQHIIKISKSHIAHGHSIYIPYLREHLPQVLTPKLIQSILKLSGILPGQKIGYNSQGGGSSVNNFHVQLIDGNSLLNNNKFHFETMQGEKITTLFAQLSGSHFKSNIDVVSFEYASALYIKISSKQHRISDKAILKTMVRAVWGIVDIALSNCIPHNLNIPNQHEVYVILRNFDMNYGWVEFSGVQIITNDHDFEHITVEEIAQRYAKLALSRDTIEEKFKKSHQI